MPFARKSFKRRYTRGRGRITARTVSRIVNKAIDRNSEDKSISTSLVAQFGGISTSWIEFNPCNPAQGVGRDQRIGSRIKLKSVLIKGIIGSGTAESALDDPFDNVRVFIAMWQNGTATPLQTGTVDINEPVTRSREAGQLLTHKYMDKYIPLMVTGTEKGNGDGYTPQLKNFTFFRRFKNCFIDYADSTTNYPNKRFLISMISDSGAAPNPGFSVGYIHAVFEDA